MELNKKNMVFMFCLVLAILGVLFMILSIKKDFSAEETDFVLAAKSLVSIGSPLYYVSEQIPSTLFLFHPPMYIFLLSLVLRIGSGEIFVRSLNILLTLLTAGVIYLFCLRIIENKKRKIIGLI